MRFRLLAPVIILAGGCLMAISPFMPYLLDDGTNAFIQARHNVNSTGTTVSSSQASLAPSSRSSR